MRAQLAQSLIFDVSPSSSVSLEVLLILDCWYYQHILDCYSKLLIFGQRRWEASDIILFLCTCDIVSFLCRLLLYPGDNHPIDSVCSDADSFVNSVTWLHKHCTC